MAWQDPATVEQLDFAKRLARQAKKYSDIDWDKIWTRKEMSEIITNLQKGLGIPIKTKTPATVMVPPPQFYSEEPGYDNPSQQPSEMSAHWPGMPYPTSTVPQGKSYIGTFIIESPPATSPKEAADRLKALLTANGYRLGNFEIISD
jgi:hypothetical protein